MMILFELEHKRRRDGQIRWTRLALSRCEMLDAVRYRGSRRESVHLPPRLGPVWLDRTHGSRSFRDLRTKTPTTAEWEGSAAAIVCGGVVPRAQKIKKTKKKGPYFTHTHTLVLHTDTRTHTHTDRKREEVWGGSRRKTWCIAARRNSSGPHERSKRVGSRMPRISVLVLALDKNPAGLGRRSSVGKEGGGFFLSFSQLCIDIYIFSPSPTLCVCVCVTSRRAV